MNQNIEHLREQNRNRLIALALAHLQLEGIASATIPIPGSDRVIAIGTPAQVRALLGEAPASTAGINLDKLLAHDFNEDVNREYPMPDNPHASVVQRAIDNRAAMWRGINTVLDLARRAEPSVTEADELATFPAYKPSGERVLQLIDEARQLTDISSSGPIPLTLIQIGYIVGHVAAEAARAARARAPLPGQGVTNDDTQAAVDAFVKWLSGRGALGPGTLSERIFIAGWCAHKRYAAPAQAGDARDAARYRWLRDKARDDDDVAPIVVMMDWRGVPIGDDIDAYGIRSGADLDRAVDVARGAVQTEAEIHDNSEGGHHD